MTLPPYPGPEGSSGDEPKEPETPAETPSEAPPEQPPANPYGQPPAPSYGDQPPAPSYGDQPPAPSYGDQPPAAPYGQQPPGYGYGAYAGANEAASRGWSGTAIASFVTSLLCCGIPAVILGIIALFRTGEGKGKGRWMAVTGISLGVVGTVAAAALFAGGYWIFNNAVTPDNAEVGECVDVDVEDNEVLLWKKDCGDAHDAEIFGVHEVTDAEAENYPTSDQIGVVCAGDAEDATADGQPVSRLIAGGEYEPHNVYEHEDTQAGDTILCLIERTDGDEMDEQVLD